MDWLWVGLGGFAGAVCRWLAGLLLPSGRMPWATLLINLTGSFLIGLIAFSVSRGLALPPQAVLFLKVGVCGGFTTFSTFSLETFGLLEKGDWLFAGLYVLLSVVLCLFGVWLGRMAAGVLVR